MAISIHAIIFRFYPDIMLLAYANNIINSHFNIVCQAILKKEEVMMLPEVWTAGIRQSWIEGFRQVRYDDCPEKRFQPTNSTNETNKANLTSP